VEYLRRDADGLIQRRRDEASVKSGEWRRWLGFDEKTETSRNDLAANHLLGRSYRKFFMVPESV
jgi:hypothetical protein